MMTREQVIYLRAHYPTEGPEMVGQALGFSVDQMRRQASKYGVHLTPATYRRLIHDAAQRHMIQQNPMRSEETVAKVKRWHVNHPEEAAARRERLLAGLRQIQRDKPSKLEARLHDVLTEMGIDFESSVVIKDKFIVDIRIGDLIIQADGDYWHGHPRFTALTERQLAQQRRDGAQDAYLRACGYTVARIWECDMSRDKVAAVLREHGLITSK